MKYKCPNCGCLNNFGMKQDNINLLLHNFCINTGALYCAIIDKHGFILASEADKSINKSIKKKILALYRSMAGVKVIDFYHKIEMITLIEDFDVVLKGFLMFIKEFAYDGTLITIIPPWLNIRDFLSEFKRILKKLSNYFIEHKPQEFPELLVIQP
jgi:hypothetical protein